MSTEEPAIPKPGSPQLMTIMVNNTELHYIEAGQGDPIVFVHGSLGDYRSWLFQFEPFAQHYRVIAYSRRYHYPNTSAGDGLDYSPLLHADDLAALVTALGLGRTHLVSSSYGAYTSLFCAKRHPQLVRSLVLGEPPDLPLLETLTEGRPLYAEFMQNAWKPATAAFQRGEQEQGVRLFIDGVLGKGVFDQLPPPVRNGMLENAAEMQAETVAPNYLVPFTCDDARQIIIPTLLVEGAVSPKLFHVITDELATCLPNAKRTTIPKASHSIHTMNPQAYNEAVLAFLARQ